jgi:hypothetical protein
VVQAGDDDPLDNTVTVHYHPFGFLNDIFASDGHSVNLFTPSVTIVKTAEELSKETDTVTYSYTITNTSTADSPNLILDSLTDVGDNNGGAGLGDLTLLAGYDSDCDELAPLDVCSFTIDYVVQAGDDDPLDNTVTVHYHPFGFLNDIFASDGHSVNLFTPSVEVVKTGPTDAEVGDAVTYTFTIFNRSSADTPSLVVVSIDDTLLGNLLDEAPAACDVLTDADGDDLGGTDQCSFTVDREVLPSDPNPLENTVTVVYNPQGFPNDVTDSDDHSLVIVIKSAVTSSSLCTFDVSEDFGGSQFRLNFTMDPANPSKWILNSTNPGQYYYNVFDTGTPDTAVSYTILIPFPFVTRGSNPIQVHDGFEVFEQDGETCFEPLGDVTSAFAIATSSLLPVSPSGAQIITFHDYDPDNLGSFATVTLTGEMPASGELYITIHLDYGFKKTSGWGKVDADGDTQTDDACSTGSTLPCTGVVILHPQSYVFSVAGAVSDAEMVQSINRFKRDPGFAGVVTQVTLYGEEPLAGVRVQVYGPSGNLVGAVTTDEDGVYLLVYKHTGKAAYYTVSLPDYGKQVKVLVKSNGWAIVNFTIP